MSGSLKNLRKVKKKQNIIFHNRNIYSYPFYNPLGDVNPSGYGQCVVSISVYYIQYILYVCRVVGKLCFSEQNLPPAGDFVSFLLTHQLHPS